LTISVSNHYEVAMLGPQIQPQGGFMHNHWWTFQLVNHKQQCDFTRWHEDLLGGLEWQ